MARALPSSARILVEEFVTPPSHINKPHTILMGTNRFHEFWGGLVVGTNSGAVGCLTAWLERPWALHISYSTVITIYVPSVSL